MEEVLNIISVPAIVLIVYWVINAIKIATNDSENFKRFIPIVACGSGIILGVVMYFAFPDMIMAQNLIYAIIIGGSSGLAATGTNQIFKQLSKSADTTKTDGTDKTDKTDKSDTSKTADKNDTKK